VDDQDIIIFRGRKVTPVAEQNLWIYYKPVGEITTHYDPQHRMTVFESVAAQYGLPRVISVGRLDINSEGLLLLTNSNALAHDLETQRAERVYKVRVFGEVDRQMLRKYAGGESDAGTESGEVTLHNVVISGERYAPVRVQFERNIFKNRYTHFSNDCENLKKTNTYDYSYSAPHSSGRPTAYERNSAHHYGSSARNFWVNITICEGKNREIRKVMNLLGLQVSRLIRVRYGPYELGQMRTGELRQLTP
jgi:23S rRNA pseudouridine2605 synthase